MRFNQGSLMLSVFSCFLLLQPLLLLSQGNAYAAETLVTSSTVDLVVPIINAPQTNAKLAPGESAKIIVTVTDNVGLQDVILFYRNQGGTKFKQVIMTPVQNSNNFSATLSDVIEPGLEYYIQATDLAENTVLRGHTFSPLLIAVSSGNVDPGYSPTSVKPSKGVNNWVWIGLGVLAVGLLSADSEGDDGGGSTTGTVTVGIPNP